MTATLDALTRRFCRALADDTDRQPMQWRLILTIGASCRIHAPAELARIVARGVEAGWFVVQDGDCVALTDAGRRL